MKHVDMVRNGEEQMSVQKPIVNVVDPDGKWLYRVGGISALILAVGYIITIPIFIIVGAKPSGVEAQLMYLAGNQTGWWAILGLMVFTDFLFVPVAFALYLALKGINRNLMLLATAFVGLFVVLDLAITWPNYAALLTLSGNYAAATNESERAVFVAAATYPSAVLASSLLGVYIILVPALGILMTGLVMLEGIFSKSTAYLGVAAGIFGILAVASPLFVSSSGSALAVLVSVLTLAWLFLAGYQLYRLGHRVESVRADALEIKPSSPIP